MIHKKRKLACHRDTFWIPIVLTVPYLIYVISFLIAKHLVLNIRFETLLKNFRTLISSLIDQQLKFQSNVDEHQKEILKNLFILYDLLADTVYELNSIFSKEISLSTLKN
ncbi:CLUMA_CG018784, isoform A [Clunio marinus]|uniref:CLUMA_CG018784, isoform A n=1 Tax=Clunio marinus TaxID=568069 RepID=A0A1J1IZR5_9DIPT|nr:CLUMA_CG018784, isoform A [Clunio marinus]